MHGALWRPSDAGPERAPELGGAGDASGRPGACAPRRPTRSFVWRFRSGRRLPARGYFQP